MQAQEGIAGCNLNVRERMFYFNWNRGNIRWVMPDGFISKT